MSLLQTARDRISDPGQVESQTKREAKEIVRAYRHLWDVYAELLQNAVDAINRRFKILNDPSFHLYDEHREEIASLGIDRAYTGRIRIRIDVQSREIEVRDNGVGIPPDRIEEFLLPEGSDKIMGSEYGFKGYGLTFAAFISRQFSIKSRSFLSAADESYELGLDGLFDWLVSDDESLAFPDSPTPDVTASTEPLEEEWNTSIRVKLADDYISFFPAIASIEKALQLANDRSNLDGLEHILRTRTAVGNTKVLFNKAPIVPLEVILEVTYADGEAPIERNIPYRYDHPKDHAEVSVTSYDFRDYSENYRRPSFPKDFRALHHIVPSVILR